MSFSATTRGLSPAWMARMPSSVISRKCISSSESSLRRLATGRKTQFAEPTPISVARNAAAISGPERGRVVEVVHHVHEAEHRADDAHRRRERAGLHERGRGPAPWRLRMRLVLRVEHGGHQVGVRAVDDELDALLGERVVDLLDRLVEGQEAVAARLLGVADDLVDAPDQVEVVAA